MPKYVGASYDSSSSVEAVAERPVQHQQLPEAVGLRGDGELRVPAGELAERGSHARSPGSSSSYSADLGAKPYGRRRCDRGRGRRSRSRRPAAAPVAAASAAPARTCSSFESARQGLTTTAGARMNQSGISAPQSSGIVDDPAAVAPNVIPSAGKPAAWSAARRRRRARDRPARRSACRHRSTALRRLRAARIARPRSARRYEHRAASRRSPPRAARRRSGAELLHPLPRRSVRLVEHRPPVRSDRRKHDHIATN